MIEQEFKLPFYVKASIFLLGLCTLLVMLFIAQDILIPIVFAIMLAIVLHPIVNFLVRKKINRVVAIAFILLITFFVIAAFGMLIITQASRFIDSWPFLITKFTFILNQGITWISGYLDINPHIIHDWVIKTKNDVIHISSSTIGQTIVKVGSGVAVMFIIPVYIFLILYYHPLLIEFASMLFGKTNKNKVHEIISQTKTLIQRYIRGLIFEFIIVAFLYSIGLLMFGIDYAIMLGFIAAILNIIPYIGGLLAISIIMVITIATKDSFTYPLLVLALSNVIHLIDNTFIIPKIVASKVKINALVSITVVIASSAMFGVFSMIICIPVIGIMKLIFDHIDSLKPWGFLLGDSMIPLINNKTTIK